MPTPGGGILAPPDGHWSIHSSQSKTVSRRNPDFAFDATKQTLFLQKRETLIRALRFDVAP